MFAFFLAFLVAAIIIADGVTMWRTAFRAWLLMSLVLGVAMCLAFYQAPLFWFSNLLGVGRPVDAVLYCVTLMLTREMFISRARDIMGQDRFVGLVRNIAHRDVKIYPKSENPH